MLFRSKVFEDSVKDYVTKEIPEGFSLVYWGLFYDRRELQKSRDSCQTEESPDDGICQCQGVKIRFWVQLKKLKCRSAFDSWLDPVVGVIEQWQHVPGGLGQNPQFQSDRKVKMFSVYGENTPNNADKKQVAQNILDLSCSSSLTTVFIADEKREIGKAETT